MVVHLVPAPPRKQKKNQFCSDEKVDNWQCRHKVVEQKFVPQMKSEVPSLGLAYREAGYVVRAVLRYDYVCEGLQ